MNSKKKIYGMASWLYCIGYLLIFLIFYLPNYVFELPESYVGTYLVAREIAERIIAFIIPTTAAATVFSAETCERIGKKMLRVLSLASCAAVYYLPYYYLYMLTFGFDSIESVCLSALMTVGDVVLRGAEILLFIMLADFFACRAARRADMDGMLSDRKAARVSVYENMVGAYFDLSHPATVGILAIAIARLTVSVIAELFDTVSYLIEDAGMYGAGEIIYIMLTYIGLLCMMVLCHLICVRIKNSIHKTTEDN